MTDKEVIMIDGVNVAGCDYALNNKLKGKEHCPNKSMPYAKETSCIECKSRGTKYNFCKNNPNCYYKQLQREKQTSQEARDTAIKEFNRAEKLNTLLQRKEQEIAQLKTISLLIECKSINDELKRLQAENDRYKQALEEIRKVAKGLAQTKIPFCQIEEQIQTIINEVLKDE